MAARYFLIFVCIFYVWKRLFFLFFCFCSEEAVFEIVLSIHQLQVTGNKSLASSKPICGCQVKMAIKQENKIQDSVTELEGKTGFKE